MCQIAPIFLPDVADKIFVALQQPDSLRAFATATLIKNNNNKKNSYKLPIGYVGQFPLLIFKYNEFF